MQITVYMMAFGEAVPIPERIVDIPQDELDTAVKRMVEDDTIWVEHPESFKRLDKAGLDCKLGLTYQYGQNDFQPKPIRSVSVGDVIKLPDGSLHRVRGAGFESLPAGTDVNTLERGIACSLL